ncbi:MAG TPA: response regulator transcription factor [Candidatus Woesebacteria bacterium]|nr:response regulator transcription factor [Candidatus Woesebacteria bacterium]
MSMIYTILVIEDDEGIQTYLKELLLDSGYNVITASDGITGLKIIKKSVPDLVLLDLGLPDMSGESVCAQIRKDNPELRIIMLTAKDTPHDVIQGLNMGADDYLTKPFVADVLLARIKARLRRTNGDDLKLTIADLTLDTKTLEVTRDGKKISLTPQELKLLQYMMQNKGRILTRDMILNRLWLSSVDIETRIVDVYIGYLRKKIDTGFDKKLIQSVRGFGYMLKD